jgi:hypothetical protein
MRYLVLVLLNLPVILLALVNIVTQYKLKRITAQRFRHQALLWLLILLVLVGSFPGYNYLLGNYIFDSSQLSSFDIIQTTILVYLIYIINNHRRKIEQNERMIRELHQEISIKLATNYTPKDRP